MAAHSFHDSHLWGLTLVGGFAEGELFYSLEFKDAKKAREGFDEEGGIQ